MHLSRGGKMKRFSLVLVLIICLGFSALALADDQIDKSLQYLYSFQDPASGGLKEENIDEPQALQSAWGAIAFAAGGFNPATVKKTDSSPDLLSYALKDICQNTSITDLERGTLVVSASGADPRNIAGCSLIDKIRSFKDPQTGKIGQNIVSTVFGVLALRSAGETVDEKTINYILQEQKADGGWDSGWGTESNMTAQTIQALTLSGVAQDDKSIIAAKNYLKSLQSETGGIKYDSSSWTTSSDAFSDAYTLEAIYTLSEDPNDVFWQKNGKTILDDLALLGNSDGSYSFSSDYGKINPVWTTSIVLVALNKKSLAFKGENLKSFYQSAISLTPQPSPTFIPSPAPTIAPSLSSTAEALIQLAQSSTPQPEAKEKTSSHKTLPSAVLVKSQTAQAQDNSQSDVKGEQNQRGVKFNWFWLPLICLSSFSAGASAKWLELKFLKTR
jgi:hypothetical protein